MASYYDAYSYDSYGSSDDCMDADGNATNADGDGCAVYGRYNDDFGDCGRRDDDDFSSNVMCCACGGGASPPTPPPAPPSPPSPPPSPPGPQLPPGHVNTVGGLQEALSNGAGRVVLAAGIYELLTTSEACNDDTAWFCVAQAVTIEAEYPGTVVLDAKQQRRVFSITGTGVELIGLNITGGDSFSNDGGDYRGDGGGLRIDGEATITLCNIYSNRASYCLSGYCPGGGGIMISGEAILNDCEIFANRAPGGEGGGIYIADGAFASLNNVAIHGNKAVSGGGLYIGARGEHYAAGGAVLNGCVIHDNEATSITDGGGGLFVYGGRATLNSCAIYGNTAGYNAGGIRSSGALFIMNSSVLWGNAAGTPSWNLDLYDGQALLFNNTFLVSGSSFDAEASFIAGKDVTVNYVSCSPGFTPGAPGTTVYMRDGSFTGCPFACPAGTFGPGGSTGELQALQSGCIFGCKACERGAVCPSDALGASQYCSPGTYNPDEGSQDEGSCRPCESGAFQNGTGATACEPCAAGTFAASKGSTACEACAAGGYCEEVGASSASTFKFCPQGTWSETIGLDSIAGCHSCGAGMYQPINGANSSKACMACPVGEVCAAGSATGTPCPIGSTTEGHGAKSLEECGCRAGTYDTGPGDQIVCQPCRSDMLCTRTGLQLATVPLLPAHWRHSNRTRDIYKCHKAGNNSACRGGVDSATYCEEGHEGPRCEWCSEPGRYYDARSAQCQDCGNLAEYASRQVIMLLAIIIGLALLRLALLRAPRLLGSASSKLAQLLIAAGQFGLQAKCAHLGSNTTKLLPRQCQSICNDACAHGPCRFKTVLVFYQDGAIRDMLDKLNSSAALRGELLAQPASFVSARQESTQWESTKMNESSQMAPGPPSAKRWVGKVRAKAPKRHRAEAQLAFAEAQLASAELTAVAVTGSLTQEHDGGAAPKDVEAGRVAPQSDSQPPSPPMVSPTCPGLSTIASGGSFDGDNGPPVSSEQQLATENV